jgi:Pvc16 N-terminal domain/Carboxypeptidase regulatory-like domain
MPDVIDDVDLTLKRLLQDKIRRPRTAFSIKFDQPTDEWAPEQGLNLNVYLYDIRENLDLRDPVPRFQLQPDGTTLRRQPPARIDLFYVVSAWSALTQNQEGQILEEHRLLADVLRTLLRYPTIPRDVLQGVLVGQQPPLPTLVAQMGDGLPHPPAEFWSSIQSRMRPSLNLIVTISLPPLSADPPDRLLPVASEEFTYGQLGGRSYRFTLRPMLLESFERDAELRAVSLAAVRAGTLAVAVRASDRSIDVADAGAIPSNTWLRIFNGAAVSSSDYVRVPVPTTSGPAALPVEPPLRFAHPSGRTIERLRTDAPPRTSLNAAVAAGAGSIPVADRRQLATNDIVMIDDLERTEFVRLTNADPNDQGPGVLPVAPTLRFAHEAGRPVRQVTVIGPATTLSAPVNQPTQEITFTAPAPALPPDAVVMIGSGDEVEFALLGPVQDPRPVQQPLRGNHPVDAPVRTVTGERLVGRLARRAAADSGEVVAAGEEAAALRLGDVVRLGTTAAQPSYHEIVGLAVEPGVAGGVDRFAHVFGRVVDITAPETPVPNATVTLVRPAAGPQPEELLVRTTSNPDGYFQFRDVTPGNYLLRTSAARFIDQDKPVTVLSTRFDEYVVRLTPN